MACEKIKVCHNTRCKQQGAPLAILDIEDLVQENCHVEKCGCLGKCGLGPNVEIEIDGVPTIHSGIRDFQTTLHLVEETAFIAVPSQVAKLGEAKCNARHYPEEGGERLKMIEDCIKMVDKEVKGMDCHPKLMADVLVMRSKLFLSSEPQRALKDAEEAVRLAPSWSQALLSLAAACEATDWPSRGLQAARNALKTGMCFDKVEVKKTIKRLVPLADEEKDNPDKFKKLRNSSQGRSSQVSESGIPKAPQQEYSSNIYTKFGGRPKFKDLAYAVHDAMFKHPLTKDFFPPTMDNSRITERNVDFLVGAFGGPKYQGPDMVITHEFLRITDGQYDVMMDCYKDAIENMHIQDMFSVPILRQLEGMRSSIVYQKNRPPPLARKYDGYMAKFKTERSSREKSQKRLKDKGKKDSITSQDEVVSVPQNVDRLPSPDAKGKAKPRPSIAAKAKAKPKAKARESSPSGDEPHNKAENGADMASSFEKGKSDVSTAPTSSFEKDVDTSKVPALATLGEADVHPAAITKCPISGRTAEEARNQAMSQAMCPFVAFLGAPGAPPDKLSLLQSLKDGRVSLASPEAEQSSPSFGVVSM